MPQELATDMFETVWNTTIFSAGCSASRADPAHIERVLRDLSLWDKKEFEDRRAVGRHEAPRADRQGAGA